jgi:4-O-beta-D-mannosyl-D-glucose phosphorylase
MTDNDFEDRLSGLQHAHDALVAAPNQPVGPGNGIFERWQNPVISRDHVPLAWRYDLNPGTNPHLMERIGVNATFNAGAMLWQGRYLLVVRVEGNDRKSFFAIAESDTGVDRFRFRDRPLTLPQLDDPDTNVYDMRLTQHEDGYIYGLFCTERKDRSKPQDPSAAVAGCGIVRTTDLEQWERLPDLGAGTSQQRNCVLHPELVGGKYFLYTRPQSGFLGTDSASGICWGLLESMENPVIGEERVLDPNVYHTVSELKNGQGPAPLKTDAGWLHLAHGVRNTAAGLRYVLYMFVTDLKEPSRMLHKPAGHLLAPLGYERSGDVSNVAFSCGWIRNDNDDVFIYYASSDTRLHVATSSIGRLVDYCRNTPEDGLTSAASVQAINALIDANSGFLKNDK